MSERKRIPHSLVKEWGPRAPIVIAGLACIYALNTSNVYWGVAGLAVCVAAGFLVERIQSKLACPDCGGATSPYEKTKEPGAAIEFYCRKCHVIWDTGRRNSSGINRENHWE